jgi:hypothetical protein
MDNLLVNVSMGQYSCSYTIDRILSTGFISQQVVIDDNSKAKSIKALVEGELIPIDIFFFNLNADKNNIYTEFNSQLEIKELKQILISHLDESNTKPAKLSKKLDNIGIAIFPMFVWLQSDILRPYDENKSSLFNASKMHEIQQQLNNINVVSRTPPRTPPRSKSRSKTPPRSRSKTPPKSQKSNTRKRRK